MFKYWLLKTIDDDTLPDPAGTKRRGAIKRQDPKCWTLEEATQRAQKLVEVAAAEEVLIFECVRVVKRQKAPISQEDVTETAPAPAEPFIDDLPEGESDF